MSWVSLSVCRTRPSGAKSPPIIFGPLVSMTCEAAAERRATSRNAAGSSPRRAAKTKPSASARRLRPRMRLTASLARPPSPILPMWKLLANSASSTGAASAAIFWSPPIKPTPSPWRTCSLVPERRDAVGIAGRGHEHDLTGGGGDERVLDHILDLRGVEHGEYDRLAFLRD